MKYNKWDVFVSHAHEDKIEIVDPLVSELKKKGLKVWYDTTELRIGDSLREKIDYGLSKSRYGIVILSKSFFKKEWPSKELNGLLSKEVDGKKVILPIWHKVSKSEVTSFSPILSDRMGIDSSKGISETAGAIINTIGTTQKFTLQTLPVYKSEFEKLTEILDNLASELKIKEYKDSPPSSVESWLTEGRAKVEKLIDDTLNKYVDKGLLITFINCNFEDFIQFYIDQYHIIGNPQITGGIWGLRLQLVDSDQFLLETWTFIPSQRTEVYKKSEDFFSADDIFSNVFTIKLLNIIKKIIGVE